MSEKEQKSIKKTGTISRREFLKDAGLVVGGIGTAAFLSSCSPASTITHTVTSPAVTSTVTTTLPAVTTTVPATPPETGSPTITLNVNGSEYKVQVEPNWTLQRTLQYKLGLTGSAKTMCDRGACGSCTVIIDGRPVLSCTTLTVECEGKKIETVEGIAADPKWASLIKSYMKWDAAQCGYCTPGFVVTAKALLKKNPNPTESEVIQALSGNLCRCGTYPRQPKAVLEAAEVLRGGA